MRRTTCAARRSRRSCRDPALDRLRGRDPGAPQGHALLPRHHPAVRRAGLPQGGRARDPSSSGSRACSSTRATRATIPTTTRRARSGSWCRHLDVPVMIHPPHVGFGEERMGEYRLASSVGRPFDLCLSLSRLIVRGDPGGFSAPEDRHLAWRRRHLRGDRPHGLCLRAAGRGLFPRLLRADEDQA